MDKDTEIDQLKEKDRLFIIEELLDQAQQSIVDNKLDVASVLLELSQAYSLILIAERLNRLIDAIGDYTDAMRR
jgi:hypothetical protein